MRNKHCYILYLLLLFVFVVSCARRPLEDEFGDLARINIHIDWSQSGLDETKVHNVSVWFFPHDGSPSFEYRYDGNKKEVEAFLPVGSYSIIAFNEAVDANWASLEFRGSEKYETFRVAARSDTFFGLSAKADEVDVRKSPDALASWSCDKYEVTKDMVHLSAQGSRTEITASKLDVFVVLTSLTRGVAVRAYVQNLTSALRCSGALTGVVGEVMLSTGKASVADVSHIFIMNNRIYDKSNPSHGYIHADLLVFSSSTEINKILQIDFELIDNTHSSPDPFDVTQTVNKDAPKIEVNVGVDIEHWDHPIILPKVAVGNDVNVDHWTNQFIPIT